MSSRNAQSSPSLREIPLGGSMISSDFAALVVGGSSTKKSFCRKRRRRGATPQGPSRRRPGPSAETNRQASSGTAVSRTLDSYNPATQSKSLGVLMLGITDTLVRLKPDVVLVLGDRGDSLITALAAF